MEESLPSMCCGWFTPAVVFLLLNLVIGSIAVASKSSHHRAAAGPYPGRFLARLRSFDLHRCRSGEIPPPPFAASDHHPEHSGRSQSDSLPPRLSAPIKKSASEAEVDEAAAASAAARETVDPAEGDGDDDVDARADDFINRFRRQLRMQRMASISRYTAMPGRGR